MIKLCWELVSSNDQWVVMTRVRVLHKHKPIQYYISSSIWLGLKLYINTFLINTRWLLGDGTSIDFWKDRWLSQTIVDFLQIPQHIQHSLKASIREFIDNGNWLVPQWLLNKSSALVLIQDY